MANRLPKYPVKSTNNARKEDQTAAYGGESSDGSQRVIDI